MWNAIGIAFVTTLFFVVPFGVIGSLLHEKFGNGLAATAIVSVVMLILNSLLFYFMMPVVGFSQAAFWHGGGWLFVIEAAITLAIASFVSTDEWGFGYSGYGRESASVAWPTYVAAAAIIAVIGTILFAGVWTDARAKAQAHRIAVTPAAQNNYPDTDANHIVLLSQDMADFKANQAMNQLVSVNTSGFQGNISTLFNLGDGVLESVAGHAYYLYALTPSGWRNGNTAGGTVPGYMQVDAENPDASAQFITKDKTGHDIAMRYVPGGYFSHNLMRHIWQSYHGQVTDDPTLEVDDNGRPYFTVSLNQQTFNRQETVPGALLLVDPQTDAIQRISLDKIPDWVDRVYSSSTVETMLNWWGEWSKAPWSLSESSANRYKVADGEDPVLVYTKGGHPVFQAIMTSYNSDTSASYLMLADARDNKATSYQIKGLTLESVATKTIVGSASNIKRLQPVHMSLHRIYGALTWVSPLESGDNHAYQGLALVRADDVSGTSVVIATTKAAALDQYRQRLAQGDTNAGPEENSNVKTISGVIADVSPPITEGQNGLVIPAFYFTLTGDQSHIYHAAVSDTNPELPFIKAGTKVRLTYFDTGAQRRDVGSYDDLSRTLNP